MLLAGCQAEIVKTTHVGHVKSLTSTLDFNAFPHGFSFPHVPIVYLGYKMETNISAGLI